jgi:hypothetical protein
MTIAIIAAVLGVLIAAAAISIPQIVRIRHQRGDEDTAEYLKKTGRSAGDIAQSNAAVRERQQDDESAERPSAN